MSNISMVHRWGWKTKQLDSFPNAAPDECVAINKGANKKSESNYSFSSAIIFTRPLAECCQRKFDF